MAKSSSFGQSCEAGPWESPSSRARALPPRLPCQLLHRSDCYTQGDGPPPPQGTPAHGVAAHRRPSRFFQSAKQLEGNPFPLSSIFAEKKSESAEVEGGGERKGRKRAKSSVAAELGSSQEPLAKPWVLGLTWFVWKGFSRGQSGITLQIASSHGTDLYQQGLWWVGFRLGGYRGGLYEFWVCLNGKGQLPAC